MAGMNSSIMQRAQEVSQYLPAGDTCDCKRVQIQLLTLLWFAACGASLTLYLMHEDVA